MKKIERETIPKVIWPLEDNVKDTCPRARDLWNHSWKRAYQVLSGLQQSSGWVRFQSTAG